MRFDGLQIKKQPRERITMMNTIYLWILDGRGPDVQFIVGHLSADRLAQYSKKDLGEVVHIF